MHECSVSARRNSDGDCLKSTRFTDRRSGPTRRIRWRTRTLVSPSGAACRDPTTHAMLGLRVSSLVWSPRQTIIRAAWTTKRRRDCETNGMFDARRCIRCAGPQAHRTVRPGNGYIYGFRDRGSQDGAIRARPRGKWREVSRSLHLLRSRMPNFAPEMPSGDYVVAHHWPTSGGSCKPASRTRLRAAT